MYTFWGKVHHVIHKYHIVSFTAFYIFRLHTLACIGHFKSEKVVEILIKMYNPFIKFLIILFLSNNLFLIVLPDYWVRPYSIMLYYICHEKNI